MSSAKRKSKKQGRRVGSMLHDDLFYDERLDELTPSAFKLLIEANQIYNGHNNGNIALTKNTLRFNWSDKTLKDAKRQLLKLELLGIILAGYGRRPTLYALCHYPVNECEKHRINKTEHCSYRATGKRDQYFPIRKENAGSKLPVKARKWVKKDSP